MSECQICAHVEERGSLPQEMLNRGSSHCDGCHLTWSSKRQAHCVGLRQDGTECHQHFSADSTADPHRVRGYCLSPEEMAQLRRRSKEPVYRLDEKGVWRRADRMRTKPVWQ